MSTPEPTLKTIDASEAKTSTVIPQRSKRQRPHNENLQDNITSFKEEIMSMMNQLRVSQNNRLDKLEEYIKSIQDQNKSIQSTNQDIEKSINHLSNNIKAVEDKIDRLELERTHIHTQMCVLEEKLQSMEILSLKTHVEIRNVPKVTNEKKIDMFGYLLTLSQAVNMDIKQGDLRDVSRLPSKKDTSSSAISVEFTNTLTKQCFLEAVKKHNHNRLQQDQLNSTKLGLKTSKQPIYISELLTPKMKRLLFLTRDFAKIANYKFVWPSNGLIYLRKAEGQPYIRVKNEVHLNELKQQQTTNK